MLKDHRYAELFPLMSNDELKELADDIRKTGLQESIVTFEGSILDGRNRYRACRLADVEPTFQPFNGSDPLGFVISMNLKRRHLTESQRSMIASKLANGAHGGNRPGSGPKNANSSGKVQAANLPLELPTQKEAAELLNVGERSVRDAKKVVDDAEPEIVKAVESGKLPVSTAAKVAELPEETQREIASSESPKKAAKKALEEADRDPIEAVVTEVQRLIRATDGLKRDIEETAKKLPLFPKFVHVESIAGQYSAARKALYQSRPTEDCSCSNSRKGPAPECKACFGTGKCPANRVQRGASR